MKFDEMNLDTNLLLAVYSAGYVMPTPIQEKAVPVLISGNDLVGRSETGSGKTLAYLMPALQKIDFDIYGVQILVVVPTRELCNQVTEEIKKLTSVFDSRIKVASLTGGNSFDNQRYILKKGAKIVVGTTGRICDHLRRRTLKLNTLSMVILDEADEMLNMGFREDVEKILSLCPEERQTVLFSATFPSEIKKIIKRYTTNAEYIEIGEENRTVSTVDEFFIFNKNKMQALHSLLKLYENKKILIFANTKLMADKIYDELKNAGAKSIHGDIPQIERRRVIEEFRNDELNILIATDVASRGLDIPDVNLVINYDLPTEIEYYIHRTGRTGRAGKKGTAITLVNNSSGNRKILELSEFTGKEIKEIELVGATFKNSKNKYTTTKVATKQTKKNSDAERKTKTDKRAKNTEKKIDRKKKATSKKSSQKVVQKPKRTENRTNYSKQTNTRIRTTKRR